MKVKTLILLLRIQGVVIQSILYMWLMPWATFDPTTFGFYGAIGMAVGIELLFARFIKFPDKKRWKTLTPIIVLWHIHSIIIISLLFIWLMPWGQFDPSKTGFYLCIAQAIVLEFILNRFIKIPGSSG